MNFKGGILIVGSLIWDMSPIRVKWRKLCLIIENSKFTPVRIRYGRCSATREDTYSIIMSNHPKTKPGQGIIVPFKSEIRSFRQLEKQAFTLSLAEGIWKEIEKPKIYAGWGTVGLLVNPKINQKDKVSASLIIERWINLYENYKNEFDPNNYIISKNEPQVIDKNGFLKLEWTEEMNEFDFLLATPVKPRPRRLLKCEEISNRMNEKGYYSYFQNNRKSGIMTFQDKKIKTKLKNKPAASKG